MLLSAQLEGKEYIPFRRSNPLGTEEIWVYHTAMDTITVRREVCHGSPQAKAHNCFAKISVMDGKQPWPCSALNWQMVILPKSSGTEISGISSPLSFFLGWLYLQCPYNRQCPIRILSISVHSGSQNKVWRKHSKIHSNVWENNCKSHNSKKGKRPTRTLSFFHDRDRDPTSRGSWWTPKQASG